MWNNFVFLAKEKLSVELIQNYNDDPDFEDLMNFVQEEVKAQSRMASWRFFLFENVSAFSSNVADYPITIIWIGPKICISIAANLIWIFVDVEYLTPAARTGDL